MTDLMFFDARKTPTTKRPKIRLASSDITFTSGDSHLVVEKNGELLDMCGWSGRGPSKRPRTNKELIEVAKMYLADHPSHVIDDYSCVEDQPFAEVGFRELSERLMSDLSDVLNAYKEATCNHPDDDIRIFRIGHAEASIRYAFKNLYGREMES